MKLIRFLFLTNFVTGAMIMIIELLGTRFMSPSFGSSLYVWTALITVALVSLSAGYAVGGHTADKHPNPAWLYSIILASGVVLMVVLQIRNPILNSCEVMGSRLGALVGAAILFGPSLFLLGMVSPYSVKLCTQNLNSLGDVVGWLYATSTFGSFVGTITAGFVLIPMFSNIAILVFCAVTLATISGLYFLFFKRKTLPAAAALFLMAIAAWNAYDASLLPSGTLSDYEAFGLNKTPVDWKAIDQTNSFYGRIRVVDLVQKKQRYLLNDGLTQGRYDMATKQPAVSFPFVLTDLILHHNPKPKNALILGLGAGFVPRMLMDKVPGIKITSIEINPKMVTIAKDYFDLPPFNTPDSQLKVVVQDARVWVKNCDTRFDAIVLDTFLGDNTPSHLLSQEMFTDLKRVMTPDGALVINIFGSILGKRAAMIRALVKTMKSAPAGGPSTAPGMFPHVHLFSYEATTTAHNLYMWAYAGEKRKRGKDGLIHFLPNPRNIWLSQAQRSLQEQTDKLGSLADAPLLCDDYNTAEHLDIPVKEYLRKGLREFWGDVLTE